MPMQTARTAAWFIKRRVVRRSALTLLLFAACHPAMPQRVAMPNAPLPFDNPSDALRKPMALPAAPVSAKAAVSAEPAAKPKAAPASPVSHKKTAYENPSVQANHTAAKTAARTKPASAKPVVKSPALPKIESRKPETQNATDVLRDAKPDPFPPSPSAVNHPQESPAAAINDGGRMLIYLVPMLLAIVGVLRMLRRFQERNGSLPRVLQATAKTPDRWNAAVKPRSPGLVSGLIGGFHLNKARERGGSNIRVVESVPIGGANLHLIEVRGRTLLLGATANGLGVLTEFRDDDNGGREFQALLQQAAVNMDSLEMSDGEMPAPLLVGSLDEQMHETSLAVVRSARRFQNNL